MHCFKTSAMKLIVHLLAVFSFSEITKAISSCRTEFDDNEYLETTIKWESGTNAVVTSTPACFDYDNKYSLRQCLNGKWDSANKTCNKLQNSENHFVSCDDNLIGLEYYCASVTLPHDFYHGCPKGFLKYYNVTYFDRTFTYWAPIHKTNDVFMYISSDIMYGKEIAAPDQITDCYIYQNGELMPTFCNESHHQLCIQDTHTYPSLKENPIEVQLKFDRKRSKLLLLIYGADNLLKKLDDPDIDAIYCFTNADDLEIKTRVKAKISSRKKNLKVYQISVKLEHPGEYWCEAFNSEQQVIKSNTLLAYKKKKGHEYSLRALLKNMCLTVSNETRCTIIDGEAVMSFLDSIRFKGYFYGMDIIVRVMKIYGKIGNDLDVVLHLTTLRNTNVVGEYFKLLRFLQLVSNVKLVWFRNADYCLPEKSGMNNLYWELTPIGEQTPPNQLCLNENALPFKRTCLGSFIEGAYWENFTGECNLNTEITAKTEELYNMSIADTISPETVIQIQNITSDSDTIIPLDVYLIANILQKEASITEVDTSVILDNMIDTVENIMNVNKTVLKESQLELNATDSLLDAIEKIFGEETPIMQEHILATLNSGEEFLIVKPQLIIHIVRPFLANVHGIALYANSSNTTDNFTLSEFSKDMIMSIPLDHTFDQLENLHNLDLATYVPLELLETISNENNEKENITVITTVFFNDNLFNSGNDTIGIPQSKVISVKIPDYGFYLDNPLPLLFRPQFPGNKSSCAYWQYGEYAVNRTGHWSGLGGEQLIAEAYTGNITFNRCQFNHLTHFALLIVNKRLIVYDPEPIDNSTEVWEVFLEELSFHENILSIITIVGSALSFIGILGIFLTALCFPRWRHKTGSKILLQLSMAIFFEIVMVHVAGADKLTKNPILCMLLGICLHYFVLAKFCWMFVSAKLQYYRFVTIFQVLPNRLMLKAMMFAWGLPLIPVGLVAGLLPNYSVGSRNFCYPSDLALYLGVFAPVAVIVCCNLIVFILIMKNVWSPDIEVKPRTSYKNSNANNRLQIYLGILLFFMLGLPWVFGILAEILVPFQLIFIYLFCLTATMQGSVIFVFYVVLDNDTRMLWVRGFARRSVQRDLK